MVILTSLQTRIEKQQRHGAFLYPDYQHYCFSNIPEMILQLFDVQEGVNALFALFRQHLCTPQPKKVILFLVDGCGFDQWLRDAAQYAFFRRVEANGIVTPITAIFPSTTSAALTTIHSGYTPQEHGLLEWVIYLEEVDSVIESLPFRMHGETEQETLRKSGVSARVLFNRRTIYQAMKQCGIPSFVFHRHSYAYSSFSKQVTKDATTIPYITVSDLMVHLRRVVTATEGAAYFYVYWDAVDAISHEQSPGTAYTQAELHSLSYMLEKEFLEKLTPAVRRECLLIMTADHGHIPVDPERTVYLHRSKWLVKNLQRSPRGKPILPWGSPRDLFLQVQPERRDAVKEFLAEKLHGKAVILRSEEALRQHLFGFGRLHRKFRRRMGNLLILPFRDHTVWYRHPGAKKFHKQGMHGGLSAEEMLIPLAVVKMSDL